MTNEIIPQPPPDPARARKKLANPALTKSVREMGRATTPDELARRGVRRLRAVGMSEVSRLIEKAVNRTLMDRTVGVDDGELSSLVAQAQSTMLELLRSSQELEESRGELIRRRRELTRELESLRDARANERPTSYRHDEAAFEAALRVSLGKALRQLGRDEVDGIVTRTLAALIAAREEEASDDRDERIDQLERRINKLVTSLDEAEAALQHLSKLKDVDAGIASIYRAVQGLSDQGPETERKQQLMATLFEANVALQAEIGATAS